MDGVRSFDLAAPIRSLLADAAGTEDVPISVTVASAVPGSVIVSPPRIEYDLTLSPSS
jgi:hypothetical protein